MMFIPIMLALIYNVTQCSAYNLTTPCWLNYTNHCVTANVLNFTNNTGLACVQANNAGNFPTFALLVYIVLEVVFFLVFAMDRDDIRVFIGVEFLSLMVGIAMITGGLLGAWLAGPIWAIFFVVALIVLALGG